MGGEKNFSYSLHATETGDRKPDGPLVQHVFTIYLTILFIHPFIQSDKTIIRAKMLQLFFSASEMASQNRVVHQDVIFNSSKGRVFLFLNSILNIIIVVSSNQTGGNMDPWFE